MARHRLPLEVRMDSLLLRSPFHGLIKMMWLLRFAVVFAYLAVGDGTSTWQNLVQTGTFAAGGCTGKVCSELCELRVQVLKFNLDGPLNLTGLRAQATAAMTTPPLLSRPMSDTLRSLASRAPTEATRRSGESGALASRLGGRAWTRRPRPCWRMPLCAAT